VTAERVWDALDRYDAAEVSRAADLVHAEAGIDAALDRCEEQYGLAIAEGLAPLAELVADASAYLPKLKALTFHFEQGHARLAAEVSELKAHVAGLKAAGEDLRAELAAVKAERDAALTRLADIESHNGALSSRAAELHAKVTRLETPLRKRVARKIRDAVTPKNAPP
jgi:chromosome segregation ATPase